jgi:hypothetical protein
VGPGVARGRVEVDEHVVGPLDVLYPAVPRVQVDAAEVRDPSKGRRLRHDGEIGRPPAAREEDVDRLEPVRMRVRNTLLVEEEAVDPVGVAEHLHGPPADVREDAVRDLEVVVDEVALRQPRLGKVDLVEVRELDIAPADSHGREPTEPRSPNPPSWGRRPHPLARMIRVPAPLT